MKLIEIVPDYFDYYCFSDQDDYWLPNKLERAISCMSKDLPFLYIGRPEYTDECLQVSNNYSSFIDDIPYGIIDQKTVLCIGCVGLGCAMVWNQKLHSILKSKSFERLDKSHDNFIGMLASCVGKVYRDETKSFYYRQHHNNASSSASRLNTTRKKLRFIPKLKNLLSNNRYELRNYVFNNYVEYCDEFEKEILALSVNYRKSLTQRIRLIKHDFCQEILSRRKKWAFMVLLGRF